MKKFLATAITLAAIAFLATPAFAGSATNPIGLSATVINNCTITTTPVAFGNYDPLSASVNNASGTVAITCTKSAATTITLGDGSHPPDVGRYATHGVRALPAAGLDPRHGLQLRLADPLGRGVRSDLHPGRRAQQGRADL